MGTVTLPHTLTPGQPENITHVKEDLEALRDEINGNLESVNLAAAVQEALIPTGTVLATARSTAPTGFLLCDGSAVSRSTYSGLFSAIGTTYGSGDGSTTFNVPDLRGRTPVGVDGAAGRLNANDALGNSGGAQTHTLTTAEMPAHAHPAEEGAFVLEGVAAPTHARSAGSNTRNASTTGNTGGGGAHNNMQPYQIVTYMVKT